MCMQVQGDVISTVACLQLVGATSAMLIVQHTEGNVVSASAWWHQGASHNDASPLTTSLDLHYAESASD